MTYKSILLVVAAEDYESDLRTAADLCATGNAHLSVILVKLAAPVPLGDYAAVSAAWLDLRAADKEQLGNAVANARTILEALAISFDVYGSYAEEAWAEVEIGARALCGCNAGRDKPEGQSAASVTGH